MSVSGWLLVVAAGLLVAVTVLFAVRSATTRRPPHLDAGLDAGSHELPACPASPNCVSSLAADRRHRVRPLPLDRPAAAAVARLRAALETMPRTRVVTAGGGYLHAECTSLVFRFVDDLELLVDEPAGVVQVRSASRTGHSDLGANRRRVEALRARL